MRDAKQRLTSMHELSTAALGHMPLIAPLFPSPKLHTFISEEPVPNGRGENLQHEKVSGASARTVDR